MCLYVEAQNFISNPFPNRFFPHIYRTFLISLPVSDKITPSEFKNNNCETLVGYADKEPLSPTNRLQSPESSTESDEICKILQSDKSVDDKSKIKQEEDCDEEDCSFVYYEEEPGERSVSLDEGQSHNIFNDISFSNCEFDVNTFKKFINNFDDEEKPESSEESDEDTKSDESDFFCDCLVEAVPLYHQSNTSAKDIMRETGTSAGKLRSLLKPANRPPPTRKNRVIFDETRNEFFDADYIILIREDCPYDEEDEEPCTCGDHELVRICCDEGCNCGYADVDDGRTPPVSVSIKI